MDNITLKILRKKLGLSLSQAAARVHVTPRTWARYEAGDRKIPEGVVHLFCIESGIEYERVISSLAMDVARRIAFVFARAIKSKKT